MSEARSSNWAQFFENSGKRYMSAKELALYLSISAKTVYSWVYKGFIKPQRIGRLVRFELSAVENWMAAQNREE